MDKTCHPYIFYKTDGSKLSLPYHKEIESTLDYLVLKELKKITVKKQKPYELIKYDTESIKSIYNTLVEPLKKVYQFDLTYKDIEDCCKHIYNAEKILYDPYGIKKKYLRLIEKYILHKPYEYSSMMIPYNYQDDLDIFNSSKSTWHHPVTNQAHNESFMELYDISLKTAIEILNLYDSYLNHKIPINDLLDYINNQNFENGMSEDFIENKYNNCIYEKEA